MSHFSNFAIIYFYAVFVWGVSSRQFASQLPITTSTSETTTRTRPGSSYNFFTNRWITTTTKGPAYPYPPTSSYNYLTKRWVTTTTKVPAHPYPVTSPNNYLTNQWTTRTLKRPGRHIHAFSPVHIYHFLTDQWISTTKTTQPPMTTPYRYSKSQWIDEPSVSPLKSIRQIDLSSNSLPSASSGPKFSTTTAEKLLSNDATLLHQILIQETSLRVELQKTVWDLMKEFEQMKKNQMEEKLKQDIINQQLMNNITSLRSENTKLKDELLVLQKQAQNESSNTGLHSYNDFTNVSKELQSLKREFRYFSLAFLDIQQNMERISTQHENITTAIKGNDIFKFNVSSKYFIF